MGGTLSVEHTVDTVPPNIVLWSLSLLHECQLEYRIKFSDKKHDRFSTMYIVT